MGELGLLAINVPEKYGGSEQDSLALAVAVEEIARACGGTGTIMSVHNCLYVNLLARCGTEEQKEIFLKPFTNGTLGCFALSEPGDIFKFFYLICLSFSQQFYTFIGIKYYLQMHL